MKKFDKNCLLCKYKYDSNACFDAAFKMYVNGFCSLRK